MTIRFEMTRTIKATPEFVFEWWTDLGPDDAKLVKPLKRRVIISRTPDKIQLQDEEQMYFQRMKLDVTVTLDRPYGWIAEYDGKSARARSEYRLRSPTHGTTILNYCTAIEPNGFFTRLFSPLAKRLIKRVFASEMSIFIETLEQEFEGEKISHPDSS